MTLLNTLSASNFRARRRPGFDLIPVTANEFISVMKVPLCDLSFGRRKKHLFSMSLAMFTVLLSAKNPTVYDNAVSPIVLKMGFSLNAERGSWVDVRSIIAPGKTRAWISKPTSGMMSRAFRLRYQP